MEKQVSLCLPRKYLGCSGELLLPQATLQTASPASCPQALAPTPCWTVQLGPAPHTPLAVPSLSGSIPRPSRDWDRTVGG